ncbi:MAG: NUDIX hydrolase [Oscillospiraceae bacterium]|nr:NUDIX hydrolase [Oscillospiraceae bacterium]
MMLYNRKGEKTAVMEYNDIYDADRNLTGRTHLRGTSWKRGEYGLVVCVWVHDGHGKLLLTQRAPEKSFPGTWENSGGAAKAGETSRQAIARELFEETGIRVEEDAFELLESGRDHNTHFDYYCICNDTPLEQIVLLPGETVDARWVTFQQVREMIAEKKICGIIARQFRRQEHMLLSRQGIHKEK